MWNNCLKIPLQPKNYRHNPMRTSLTHNTRMNNQADINTRMNNQADKNHPYYQQTQDPGALVPVQNHWHVYNHWQTQQVMYPINYYPQGWQRNNMELVRNYTTSQNEPYEYLWKMRNKLIKDVYNRRMWSFTEFGKECGDSSSLRNSVFRFTLMSFNILSQTLLEDHRYLYRNIKFQDCLNLEFRKLLLKKQLLEYRCDVLCLQEVEEAIFWDMSNEYLVENGFQGCYKKKTGDKVDGCAIFFREKLFEMVDFVGVDYYHPEISVLNRHNVGLIAKLVPKVGPYRGEIIVATTHLLFNMKRCDVRFAQLQLLLTEIDRFAYKGEVNGEPQYLPVIITGDMNFTSDSGTHSFLTTGQAKLTQQQLKHHVRITEHLDITQQCQHASLVEQRQAVMNKGNTLQPITTTATETSDFIPLSTSPVPEEERTDDVLSHSFNLLSVYSESNSREVTVKQGHWKTVDYIMYSGKGTERGSRENQLRLISRLTSLTGEQCDRMGGLPNPVVASDHLPIVAKFAVKP